MTFCSQCPVGKYQTQSKKQSCSACSTACPHSKYQTTLGTCECSACPTGYYVPTLKAPRSSCYSCPTGSSSCFTIPIPPLGHL
jgi:hypothetical protein